jgi:uncharacterized protein DUF955
MDLAELEGLAMLPYAERGIDPENPPPIFDLIRAFLGVRVQRPANMPGPPASRFVVGGQERIAVKASVPIEYAAFYAAHELGHVLLRRSGFLGADEESCADYLGAALLMPRAAVLALYRAEGFAPRALAESIVCTQTAAALRLGEVLTAPLAAVSPAVIRVRGPSAWVWPDERTIRAWAQRPRPGLSRVRLTDQPRRVALLADEDLAETG